MKTIDPYASSRSLAARAARLIPGGHHLSGRPLLPSTPPLYIREASGARVTDADGRRYIDFLMAYGPFVLGYAHPEVDAAARARLATGHLVSLNHPLHLDFVERVVGLVPDAKMGMFFRTGSEATTAALRIARRATGRTLVARCGYHGWHDWCVPDLDGVPEGLDRQVLPYDARDPSSLAALLDHHPARFAAVILAPEMIHPPDARAVAVIRDLCTRHGALLVMDEVKTGIRAPGWTMQAGLGIAGDMTTLSKALGNGWAIAAVVGREEVLRHAAGLHVSATYHGDVAAMAAAMATLDIVARDGVQDDIARLGQRLIDGLNAAAARHGIPAAAYGEPIPAMPFMAFRHPDPAVNAALAEIVYGEALAEGVLLHPRHLWFVSAAHSAADIDHAVAVVDHAMAQAGRRLGMMGLALA
ncbi:aminotransferase class III-fold pyridoxal phosphate-dependent enzyme [Alsobacter sp. R-9]